MLHYFFPSYQMILGGKRQELYSRYFSYIYHMYSRYFLEGICMVGVSVHGSASQSQEQVGGRGQGRSARWLHADVMKPPSTFSPCAGFGGLQALLLSSDLLCFQISMFLLLVLKYF